METIQVQGAPNLYRCHKGALSELKQVIIKEQWKKGLLVHGTDSWTVASPFIQSLNLPLVATRYHGECTREEVMRIATLALEEGVDYILGVGGGKIIDLVKATADRLQQPFLLVPTLASNCAPWTPLSVFYDQEGRFTDYVVFSRNAFMVAIEPNIIMNSPASFLRAGIGDTLAKWYEADVLVKQLDHKPISVNVAVHAARLCHDVLLEHGAQALQDHAEQKVTRSFIQTVETIIMAGGMVGGFGDRYGRIAGAHSIHNGLTVLPQTHDKLHGDKVAYGILVQLALENRFEEIEKLLPYYRQLKLPTSLKDLGVIEQQDLAFERVAKAATKATESIHFMERSTEEAVAHTMKQLETWIMSKQIQDVIE
ncbi:iron-containing alcohol dehydrogenase family protein [Amphibacillus cookii]|uniref:iron-containing alcohol dehydrogenase family protein n=1 Tax=Amphibacillus cookii TaxID=767787 RepID=UPI0019594E15|nr:iron-containing alcohol dehydrogenase family protein [Amphibacillus cookii]MBM7541024.1 putative oxidoreductase [Amphibacillus cookii]